MQPTPPVPRPLANMGESRPRYEARAKVTGEPIYAADLPVNRTAHAWLVGSAIAKGKIASIDTRRARAVPGVIEVFTHENAPKRQPVKHMTKGGRVSDSVVPLGGRDIHHDGQIVAMVVAETPEAAREASYLVDVRYAPQTPSASLDSAGTSTVLASAVSPEHNDKKAGDFEGAWAAAPVKVDHEYRTPTQHHNPIELFSTTAIWNGDQLTIHEPSQFVYGLKGGVAEQLGIDGGQVHVLDPFVGGAFGSKGMTTQRTALVAGAAKIVGRPLRLVVTRDQGFTTATYRAETRQRVRIGAEKNGKLTAFAHEGWELTSRADDYMVGGTEASVEIYGAPNVWTQVSIVHADRNTPGFMRSPPEVPYIYALESAMDELAYALDMDPVELRRRNDVMQSPINGAPYSSRSLMKCYDEASASFGWSKRNPKPMSMRDGDWLIGWGCATACYPTNMMPATARVRLGADGRALVQIAAHDVGTGAYTAMSQIAAEKLGIDAGGIRVEMGDSKLPPGPVAGGSMTTASAGSAVAAACDKIIARFGNDMPKGQALKSAFAKLGTISVEDYAEWYPPGSGPEAVQNLYQGKMGGGGQKKGEDNKKPLMFAFGAEFVEVRIHRLTCEIRVPRMTGAFAGGRIINPRTARSQYLGGMIWGMSSALHEATEIDELRARYVNDNLADYLVPVNADVPRVDIIMVPEVDDKVNPLGVKGIGELANVGTAAAVANAVYHATGKRIRDLPITLEKLL